MGLDTRLKLAKLHLITDLRSPQGDLKDFVVAALRGGVDLVQLRDPDATDEQLAEAFELVRSAAQQLNAGVVLSCSPQTAKRLGADYLHLGAAAGRVTKRELGRFQLAGRSVHTIDQAKAAQKDAVASWMFVGPVFSEPRHPGLELVGEVAKAFDQGQQKTTPWFAVGGITEKNIEQVIAAGALRVAVSSAINNAGDPQAAAERLKAVLQAAWDSRPEMEQYGLEAAGGAAPIAFAPASMVAAAEPVEAPVEQDQVDAAPAEVAELVDLPVVDDVPVESAEPVKAPVESAEPVEAPVELAEPVEAPVVHEASVVEHDQTIPVEDEAPIIPVPAPESDEAPVAEGDGPSEDLPEPAEDDREPGQE